MRRVVRTSSVLALPLLAALGCGAHSTDLTIPEKKLPSAFERASTGPSAGALSWRRYFADAALADLIGSAIDANLDLQIALQRIELARAGVHEATGALLPQVSVGAGVGLRKYGRYTEEGAGNATTDIRPGTPVPVHLPDFTLGLEAAWEIDAWGKLRDQRRSAVAQYLATVEGSRFVVTNLVADVASAYFELLALDRTLDVLAQTVARQSEALEVVKLQKEAGRTNELAVQQFASQLASTSALKAAVELRIKQTENFINVLRGSYPQPVARTRDGLLAPVASSVATGVPADLLRNRPDIRAAEQQLRATQCDLRAARAAFYPSINIAAGVGFEAFNPKFLFSTPASVAYASTLGLVAPLVNRSAIEAQFNAAKALQIEAMYNYQRAVLTAYVEVANGLAGLQANTEIVELKQQQRAAVEQTVATADTLFRAGKASYFEVLMAQQNTLSADLEWIDAVRDHHLASVGIYRALGGGWRD